jgi:hypothetical protein
MTARGSQIADKMVQNNVKLIIISALLTASLVSGITFSMAFEYKGIGFIGLGMMGVPMIENLIRKTPPTTHFHVFDVSDEAVRQLCEQYPERVQSAKTSREVAERAVCMGLYNIY